MGTLRSAPSGWGVPDALKARLSPTWVSTPDLIAAGQTIRAYVYIRGKTETLAPPYRPFNSAMFNHHHHHHHHHHLYLNQTTRSTETCSDLMILRPLRKVSLAIDPLAVAQHRYNSVEIFIISFPTHLRPLASSVTPATAGAGGPEQGHSRSSNVTRAKKGAAYMTSC